MSQSSFYQEEKYGPRHNYLNIIGYNYSFSDLKKDTLIYPYSNIKPAAIFIQHKSFLLNAEFKNKSGKIISSGTFKDGNGVLIVELGQGCKWIYTFKNGMLNDTTVYVKSLGRKLTRIYKDNILIKEISQIWLAHNRIDMVTNYDDEGLLNDTTFTYGNQKCITIIPILWQIFYDPYKGKLNTIAVYEHGLPKEGISYWKNGSIRKKSNHVTTEVIEYKKNGAVKYEHKDKVIPKTYPIKPAKKNKNCL